MGSVAEEARANMQSDEEWEEFWGVAVGGWWFGEVCLI